MLMHNGTTVETIRELIFIPATTEQLLHEYLVQHPEERKCIERVIDFLATHRREFERLLGASRMQGQRQAIG